jgi:putative hydrolase of the HAD superfamily
MPLSAVIFDMDDVLCDYHVAERVRILAEMTGNPPERVEQAIWGDDFLDRSDRGALSADAYLAEFGRRLAYPLTEAQWIEARRRAMPPFVEMLALAEALKSRVKLALLTNNDFLVKAKMDGLFPELGPIFSPHLYVSAEFGVAKPDPACFLACCERLGVAPDEAFFIDDRPENVAGARQAGLSGHVFAGLKEGGVERLRTSLARHGLAL